MPRYRVTRNWVAAAIIHIESYLTILGLIEQELANLDIILERLVEIRRAHLEFQRLFYSRSTNRPVQYNELIRFLRDYKLPFEKQNGKQKKKFLAMA